MNKTRVIPVLLISDGRLIKTRKFKEPKYIGDPINAIRIFNEKEVDELVLLDISAHERGPSLDLLRDIAVEAFMPLAYGGGVSTVQQVEELFTLGFEKVIFNTICYRNFALVSTAAKIFGSQSIVVSADIKQNFWGKYELYSNSGKRREATSLGDHLQAAVNAGAGEIILNSIDRDGTMSGYDLSLLELARQFVRVPLVACGGAGSIDDLASAIGPRRCDAVAAGSLFVFVGPHRAVLINYPDRSLLSARLP